MFARLRMASAVLLLTLPIAFLGCGDDATTVPTGDDTSRTGVAQGELNEALGSFEIRTNAGPDPERPMPGPFLIMGGNIGWVDSVSALRADLMVRNISGNTYAEPVTLTFTRLWPDSVRVTDLDGVEADVITFEFDNDDAMWTDGETSLPVILLFGKIEEGQPIGFTARIDVAMMPGKGSIGGVVFDDQNENGVRDEDERGVGGAGIALGTEGMEPIKMRTQRDGTYRFDGLEAGLYTVLKLPSENMRPTTPSEVQVILTEEMEGGISSFLEADFGCFVMSTPPDSMPPLVEVGDCVHATGILAREPYRVLAFGIDHEGDDRCDDDHKDGDGEWDDDDGDDGDDCAFGELRGPVTEIDLENRSLAVLGTWVKLGDVPVVDPTKDDDDDDRWHECQELALEDLAVGDRVRVRTMTASDPGEEEMLQGYRLRCWNGRWSKVKGVVDSVETNEDGMVTSFTVLHTTIVPMRKDGMDY